MSFLSDRRFEIVLCAEDARVAGERRFTKKLTRRVNRREEKAALRAAIMEGDMWEPLCEENPMPSYHCRPAWSTEEKEREAAFLLNSF